MDQITSIITPLEPCCHTASDSFDSRRCNMTHHVARIWRLACAEQFKVSADPRKIIQNHQYQYPVP